MHTPPLILIADDDQAFREIVSVKLRAAGYWVAEAMSGDEAFERAKTLKPDLIVVDMHMPSGNGAEALLDIKSDPELGKTPVFILSSEKDPWPTIKTENPSVAKELGADDYLYKEDDLDKNVGKIAAAIKRISDGGQGGQQ
ncbi:MAG: response regulator [Candidatus Harrisonbacteria bacterium CG10_big_fil_rev_8_21_14_0_10_42_17]|uniref:Response regulator n=1 Tax=Candidatus Harrisonbacteria bacterium CG10_big_fil_rev_8_21_14_0_10_42_17 TaxID=1974584 RepID=A0A2M6WIL4_9BACT|nr:MAG: response regulator [Candidatus Harrisonbacteria bacterium CG10_big_fil_rev_8_21_14_0_10_42_17]